LAYLIVQYWHYLAASPACGVLVGWWAQGTRRSRRTEPGDDLP